MNATRLLVSSGLAVVLANCSPIRTETMSLNAARGCLNNTVDFGHDGGVIRPDLLRAMGVRLLIHRATRGGTGTDADYARRERPARAAGLQWGAYHYLKRRENMVAQVHRFVNVVAATARRNGTVAHRVMLVLDNEGADRVSWAELARAAQMVRGRTGVWPLLYCSVPLRGMATFDQQCRELEALSSDDRRVLKACGLWIPRYGEQPNTHVKFSVPRVFGDWTFWQYCGDLSGRPKTALAAPEFSGNVGAAYTRSGGRPALRHFCDRDLFNGSQAQFERFYLDHSSPVALWR
jgi:lysozyme